MNFSVFHFGLQMMDFIFTEADFLLKGVQVMRGLSLYSFILILSSSELIFKLFVHLVSLDSSLITHSELRGRVLHIPYASSCIHHSCSCRSWSHCCHLLPGHRILRPIFSSLELRCGIRPVSSLVILHIHKIVIFVVHFFKI